MDPDLDCKDFPTQGQAQACYNYCKSLTGRDVFGLDRDNDGIACGAGDVSGVFAAVDLAGSLFPSC